MKGFLKVAVYISVRALTDNCKCRVSVRQIKARIDRIGTIKQDNVAAQFKLRVVGDDQIAQKT